ncbi:MAG TPA: hypothetical protein VGN42_18530 [Pirellulales bacterium]|nr:hypothetical protein [Pirellulales bacterium]
MSELLKIDDRTSDLALPLALANHQIPYGGLNALDEGFDLSRVFEALDIWPDDSVYINWHRFNANEIDAITVADLTLYFDDIWYPSSDDIDIFDDTLCWVLVVSHEGMIGFIKF